MLSQTVFNTKIRSARVERKEKVLGYFLGPIGVSVLASILNSYLNVYYTDVLDLSNLWGGAFLTAFPLISKILGAAAFLFMARLVDRTRSPQGKARPWILFSAPVLLASMVMLFVIPGNEAFVQAIWIFVAYNLFYTVGYTAYSTSHTLLVPLATRREGERNALSLATNALNMVSGTFLAILFPCVLMPAMGTDQENWILVIVVITAVCCSLLLMEYYYTVERVTLEERAKEATTRVREKLSSMGGYLWQQLRLCVKSSQWNILMLYMIIYNLFNFLSSYSIFYYCNWVLGTYNDGITQALFYGLGNAPLGLGIFLCTPICRKLGRKNAMMYGYFLAAIGCLICYIRPQSLALVLTGQAIKAFGLIPSTFMVSTLLADALDDVERESGLRCDGFSSSAFQIISTITGGIALGIFNFMLARLDYQAPAQTAMLPVQNAGICDFFSFCALGAPMICYVALGMLLFWSGRKDS